ncbi:hypothetical protein EDB85DRAFT_787223 [Lactarius pseudohatsudake]|nr:hypothetical protein EDB85DRAFT_787223 [Lactarius pseudohatsudake]
MHRYCADTTLLFHHYPADLSSRGCCYGLCASGSVALCRIAGPIPKNDPCTCLDLLKIRVNDDFELIPGHTSRSHSWTGKPNGARTRTATVDHSNPSAWRDTSATAPSYANDVEVLDGLLATLGAQDPGRLTRVN